MESGVKQGCLLSGLLFVIVIDWLMKRTTEGRDTGVEWVNGEILEDIDYADDLALPSEGYEDAQEKMTRLARRARGCGNVGVPLDIHSVFSSVDNCSSPQGQETLISYHRSVYSAHVPWLCPRMAAMG